MSTDDRDRKTAEAATHPALAETAAPSWWDPSAELEVTGNANSPVVEPVDVSPSHYEMLGEHGRGGLGRVMRARDRRTGRIVAIKEILRDSEGAVRRFRREALVTANLQHPAIVPVYEVGQWPDGQPFYAMKLVEGVPLSAAIRDAADGAARLALLPHVIQVADALGYAHSHGWIHRDLKPSNVLVGAFGETVVIDWGLAKRIREDSPADEPSSDSFPSGDDGATVDGQVLGTPVYMSPEQANGDLLDARADVYAIGALLYHVLAGVPPYHDARTAAEVVARVIDGPPRALGGLAPGLPAELLTIVLRAMAHRAADRYPSARELSDDLSRFRAGNLVAAHRYTARELVRRWLRRHRAAVAVAALAAFGLATVGVVSIRENVAARRRAQAESVRATAAQGVADQRRVEVEQQVGALHTELGLRELSGGSPARALPYFADAYRRTPQASVTRFLLGRALESVASLEQAVAVRGVVMAIAVTNGRAVAGGTAASTAIDLDDTRPIREVAGESGVLSPDGKVAIALGAGDQTLIAFDATTGVERARRAIGGVAMELAIDGRGQVVVYTGEGRIEIYDLDLRPIVEAQVPFPARAVTVARSGRVFVGGADGDVWVWQVGAGVIAHHRSVHRGEVRRICASTDGATWMSMDDHAARLWRGTKLITQAAHLGRPEGCDIDAGGGHAVTMVEGRPADGWDLSIATPVPVSLGVVAISAAIAADGSVVALGGERGTIDLLSMTGRSLARFVGHDAPTASIEISPDGRHIVSATAGGDVRVWRNPPTSAVVEIDLGATGRSGGFLDEDRAVVVGTTGAQLVSSADGHLLANLPGHREEVRHAAVTVDGARVATGGRDHAARLWRGDGTPVAELAAHTDRVVRIDFSQSGERVLTASADGTFAIWRAVDGVLERRVTAAGPLYTARISGNGKRVVTVTDGAPKVTLWDADTGQQLADLPFEGEQPTDVRFSPDGELVAIATSGPVASVYDGRAGTPRFRVAHEAQVFAVAWSSDGALLATGDLAGVVRLSRGDGSPLRSLRIDVLTTSIGFHPDHRVIAIGTANDVRIVELATGRELARQSTDGMVVKLEFSPSGDRLLIGQAGPGVRIWQLGSWMGTPAELDRRLRCAVPYRLDADGLVSVAPDPASCD